MNFTDLEKEALAEIKRERQRLKKKKQQDEEFYEASNKRMKEKAVRLFQEEYDLGYEEIWNCLEIEGTERDYILHGRILLSDHSPIAFQILHDQIKKVFKRPPEEFTVHHQGALSRLEPPMRGAHLRNLGMALARARLAYEKLEKERQENENKAQQQKAEKGIEDAEFQKQVQRYFQFMQDYILARPLLELMRLPVDNHEALEQALLKLQSESPIPKLEERLHDIVIRREELENELRKLQGEYSIIQNIYRSLVEALRKKGIIS